jgi:hypothetical protein
MLVMALLPISCAGTEGQSTGAINTHATGLGQAAVQLFPVAIVFDPALAMAGTLSVRHESGWAVKIAAPPSGVDLAMPEGPASLQLIVGGHQFERTLKVSRGSDGSALSCVWQLPQ